MRLSLSGDELDAVEREYCARSLAGFVRRAWPILEPSTEMQWGWATDCLCEHLEAVTAGQISRLLINVPPGMMKSLLTSVFWPAWEWGPKGLAGLRYLSTAHKQDLAVRDSTKMRRLIQSEWFQRLWQLRLTGDQNAKTKFENTATGWREASAFASTTGARASRVIIDDPHSVDDANSRAKLAGDVLTFREALPSRVSDSNSAIVIIMQRLAVGDISDVALDLGYEHVCLPMRYEPGRSRVIVGKPDPRMTDGELLFPDRFPVQDVERLEAALGSHASAGQLQQRPTPRGGGVIKGVWFGRYSIPPDIQYRAIFADTAQKTGERNDFSVFQLWGRTARGKAYLLDQIRGKWEAPDLLRQAIDFWRKATAAYPVRGMYIEDKASGTGLIQELKANHGVPVIPVPRSTDKYTRVMDALPFIEAGHVLIPDAPWASDFVGECEAFTADNTHQHDDQIDPMTDAIRILLAGPTSPPTGASRPRRSAF